MKTKTCFVKILLLMLLVSCDSKQSDSTNNSNHTTKEFFVVPGEDEFIDQAIIKKGEVLVAYSDCYQCHKEESKAKEPSFSDIAGDATNLEKKNIKERKELENSMMPAGLPTRFPMRNWLLW